MKPKLVLTLLALIALVACGGPTATPAAVAPTAAPAATTGAAAAATEAPAAATAAPVVTEAATAAPAATEAAPAATAAATTDATTAATSEASSTSKPVDIKGASAATIADTNGGYYQMQSQLGESKRCLEGQGGAAPGSGAVLDGAAFMDTCQNVTGQTWKLVVQTDGYYHLQNRSGEEKNLCLEGNRLAQESVLAGAAVMNTCSAVTGQSWKFVDAGSGYYHLQTKFLEADNKCLEGQAGAAPGSGAVLNGAAFMNDCQDVSGQRWTFTPIDPGGTIAVVPATDATAAPDATAASTTAAPDTTAAPATAVPAATAAAMQPTVNCDPQYAAEIAKFKDAIIAEIAQERAEATQQDGIARAPVLWNDQLACQAQEWSQALATGTYRQNPHCCYAPIPVHSNSSSWKIGAAEGIAGGKTAVEGMQAWRTGEMKNYDFAASEAAKRKDHTCLRQICGHYGAVIGLFTTEAGCGFYPPQAGKESNYNFVCQYIFKQAQ